MIYYVSVPQYFLKLHKFITLMAYVMSVNCSPLLITMSRGIKFVTAKHITTFTYNQLIKSLKMVTKIYSRSRMIVQNFLMDMDFDKTIYDLV